MHMMKKDGVSTYTNGIHKLITAELSRQTVSWNDN